MLGGQIAQERLPGRGDGGTAHVHEGGRLPEGEVITAGEEAVAVGPAFGKGGVGEGLLEGGEERVAGGVEGVSVLGGWVAEGSDQERAAEHAWLGWSGRRRWKRWGS